MDRPATADRAPVVLVVDDNRDAADSLAAVVGLWGYRPAVAYDGRSALEAARSRRPLAALLDLGLPGLDGPALAALLRAEFGPGLLLVAVTGHDRYDEHRAREAGFDRLFLKPIDPDELRRLLARHLPMTPEGGV